VQGDALDAPTVAALSRDRDLGAILALRRADERAKDPHARPPDLDTWRSFLEQIAR
jgi:hypothetical protein